MTRAVAIVIATRATAAILDSRGPRSRLCTGTRRARSGASSSPTVKRELYSSTNGWPSRPSDSAYERRKPRTYVGAGRMSKCSSSSARRYFGRIFVRSSSSGKSRFWRRRASRRLEPMSNTRGMCSRSRSWFRRSLLARADVLEQAVHAERDEADAARHRPRRRARGRRSRASSRPRGRERHPRSAPCAASERERDEPEHGGHRDRRSPRGAGRSCR